MSKLKPLSDSPSPAKSTRSSSSTYRRSSTSRSNPSTRLSHLFSQPSAPLPPTISDTHSHSASATSTPGLLGATSEEALLRQLDRDAGGERMGLRSRRSSSATIQTLRNVGRQVSEEVVAEEEHEAGPSRLHASSSPSEEMGVLRDEPLQIDVKAKGKGKETVRGNQVNPKKSLTWQRWNQSSTFPKASVADPSTFETPPPLPAAPSPSSITEAKPPDIISDATITPSSDSACSGKAAEVAVPPRRTEPQSWWSRGKQVISRGGESTMPPLIVDMEGLNASTVEPIPVASAPAMAAAIESQAAHVQPGPLPTDAAVVPPPSTAAETLVPPLTLADDTESPQRSSFSSPQRFQPPISAQVSAAASAASGGSRWYNYLGFPGVPVNKAEDEVKIKETSLPQKKTQETIAAAKAETEAKAEAEAETRAADSIAEPDTTSALGPDPSMMNAAPAVPEPVTPDIHSLEDADKDASHADPEPEVSSSVKSSNRWGGYIYSLVVPQINEGSSSRPSSIRSKEAPFVELPEVRVDPAVEQAPVTSSALPVLEPAPSSVPALGSDFTAEPVETSATPETLTSAAQAQPHPAPPASTWLTYLSLRAAQKTVSNGPSVSSSKRGRRSSTATEEVMDLSNDADFPAASPSPAQIKADPRKKRLSITSKSASQVGGRTSLDEPVIKTGAADGSASVHGPVTQPNFVVPTFDTTFNRPPRSLPPPHHAPRSTTSSPPGGLTASAAGIAWKAWGTVSSYVYGGAPAAQQVDVVDEKETRGMKEGRDVGADLPRPLREEPGNESWRNVKRVVVFGVHGWFPAKMLNSLIGEPTGTSTKFANMTAQAVRSFLAERAVTDIRLTIIPLEGEGTIESRVDRLYKAYLSSPSYINDTRRADAIFFAAHSQGCIVTTHLISRLIAQGHIRTANNADAVARCDWAFGPVGIMPPDPRQAKTPHGEDEGDCRQRVALLDMCGVHLGPFYSLNSSNVIQPYLQWFENNAARELFEFQDTLSPVSQAYHKALAMILDNEVKVLLLSSLNDQVVPIYSSSFSTATHPLLLRALYVDGACYSTSDFMTKLIAFALMLRNAGIDDEGLISQLSEATAGGLTGIGHSTPYESPACYDMAVAYLFNSGPARLPMPPLEVESFTARDAKNDFELPWILRALTDAPAVKDLFSEELKELKQGVVDWRPVTKALKDIKKRLEPMAGKQSRLRTLNYSASSTSLAFVGGKDVTGSSPSGSKLSAGLKRDW